MNFLINLSGPFLKTLLEKILGKIIQKNFSETAELCFHDLSIVEVKEGNTIRLHTNLSIEINKNDIFKILQKQGWI